MYPAEIAMNVLPDGGVVRANSSSPQQTAEPLALSPHTCVEPVLIEVSFVSAGGVNWPKELSPQQMGVPSDSSAHE